MELMIPTNWDDQLVYKIKDLPVNTLYGKLHSDFFGGGRPSMYIPSVSKKKASEHISLINEKGYKFNYLLNSSCMSNIEFTRRGQHQMHNFMEWLLKNEVDGVTVAIPYLARWIKKNYPSLKIRASIIADINTVRKVKFWNELGADNITLTLECNRDFNLLKSNVKNTNCKITLLVNLACLHNCPFTQYHYVSGSHASQSEHKLRGFYIDYCIYFCSYYRLLHPVEIIRSGWIRPEDLGFYEDIGISNFKIIGRVLPTDKIIKITTAYSKRNYNGNLLDILSPFTGRSSFNLKKFVRGMKYMFRPFDVNIFRLRALGKLVKENNFIELNNKSLNGFLKGFNNKRCREIDCDNCGYCDSVADKVIKVDYALIEKAKYHYKHILDKIDSGEIFRYF